MAQWKLPETSFVVVVVVILVFLGPHLWYMEVPRLGVQSELYLLAYTTATATPDPSHICNLHHSHGNPRSLTH